MGFSLNFQTKLHDIENVYISMAYLYEVLDLLETIPQLNLTRGQSEYEVFFIAMIMGWIDSVNRVRNSTEIN